MKLFFFLFMLPVAFIVLLISGSARPALMIIADLAFLYLLYFVLYNTKFTEKVNKFLILNVFVGVYLILNVLFFH